MIRIVVSCLLILSTIIYCVVEKNNSNKILKENCIEIYVYKEPILPENCVWYRDSKYYKVDEFDFIKEFGIIDTVNNSYSQGGIFIDDMSKIEKKPILKNIDVIAFDCTKSNIILKQDKSFNLSIKNKKIKHLKQFVITLNKKSMLNGYFFNVFSSSVCKTNQIIFFGGNSKNLNLLMLNYKNKRVLKLNLKQDYPELYHAFKNSNRLIE